MRCWSLRLINFLIKSLAGSVNYIANVVDFNFYIWAFYWNIISDNTLKLFPSIYLSFNRLIFLFLILILILIIILIIVFLIILIPNQILIHAPLNFPIKIHIYFSFTVSHFLIHLSYTSSTCLCAFLSTFSFYITFTFSSIFLSTFSLYLPLTFLSISHSIFH